MSILPYKTKKVNYKKSKNSVWSRMAVIFACTFAFLMPATASAEEIFAELTENKMVDSAYVSGRFAHGMRSWRSRSGSRGINFSDGFSSLYSYTCNSEESVNLAKRLLKNYLKRNPDLEVVMSSKEGNQEYVLYEQFDKKQADTVLLAVIWNQEAPNFCEIVVVDWKKGYRRGQPYSDYSYLLPEDDSLEGLASLSVNLAKNLASTVTSSTLSTLSTALSPLVTITEGNTEIQVVDTEALTNYVKRVTEEALRHIPDEYGDIQLYTE